MTLNPIFPSQQIRVLSKHVGVYNKDNKDNKDNKENPVHQVPIFEINQLFDLNSNFTLFKSRHGIKTDSSFKENSKKQMFSFLFKKIYDTCLKIIPEPKTEPVIVYNPVNVNRNSNILESIRNNQCLLTGNSVIEDSSISLVSDNDRIIESPVSPVSPVLTSPPIKRNITGGAVSHSGESNITKRNEFSIDVKKKAFDLQFGEHPCPICEKRMYPFDIGDDKNKMEFDHITSCKNNGTTDISNCVAICSECNKKKGSKNIINYLEIFSTSKRQAIIEKLEKLGKNIE